MKKGCHRCGELETRLALAEAEAIGLRDLLADVREELGKNDGRIGRASTLICRITAAVPEDLHPAEKRR